MSDEGRDNISLLDSGGGQGELIPVQGGGGGENNSLLSDGTELEQLVSVQGGGDQNNLVATHLDILRAEKSDGGIIGPNFNEFDANDKIDVLRSNIAIQMIGDNIGLNEDQIAEIIVNSNLAKAKKVIRKKNGLSVYDVDSATQAAIDNGSPGERQAAREALASYDGTGKSQEEQLNEKADLIREGIYNYNKKNETTIVRTIHSKLKGKVLEFKTPLKKKIDNLKDIDINRDEFQITTSDNLKFKLVMNITSWMDGLSEIIKKRFPTIVKTYIKTQENNWNNSRLKNNLELPLIREPDLKSVYNKISRATFDEPSTYGRFVAVLPYTVQQFVVIPPIKGSIKEYTNVLLTLQMLNLIKFKRGAKRNSWQVAKNTVIIFSHPFYEYNEVDSRKETNRQLFTYVYEMETDNRQRVFCLSDGGSAELSRVGFADICNLDSDMPQKHIKSGAICYLPTLMSPTHVLFPYQLNSMNGILISGERELRIKNKESNMFNEIYRGASYGTYDGRLIRNGYPVSVVNSNICAIRMDNSLKHFIKETQNDNINSDELIKTVIGPLEKKIIDQGEDPKRVTDVLYKYAKDKTKTERGGFIILMEAVIKVKRAAPEISGEITEDRRRQEEIRRIIGNYELPDYEKYLRYPFTGEVNYIRNKMNGDLLRKSITPSFLTQMGGSKEECARLRVKERTRTLTIFDKELYITDNILVLHVKPGFKPEECPPPINLELYSATNNHFREHDIQHQIIDRNSSHLIKLGGKIFQVRESYLSVVINNWQGLTENNETLPLPILTQGEADLLNSLQITPQNMDYIFFEGNPYGLDNWRTAFSDFFTNLVLTKCYKNTILLTNSECQRSRNFLYSIRQYIDKEFVTEDLDDTDSSDDSLVKRESSSESDEDDKELNDGDIINESGVQEMKDVTERAPSFAMHSIDGVWRPSVKVVAFHKRTGDKKYLTLHLSDGRIGDDGSGAVSEEQKNALKSKIHELKQRYPKYIIHTY